MPSSATTEELILRDGKLVSDLVSEKDGRISRRIYTDPEIFEFEQERIFRQAWQFLAHESELSEPGDYLVRNLAGESVVLIKGDDQVIRVFLNSCRHRGMRVCRADRDNVRHLRCVYHGWTYDRKGDLVAAFAEQLYTPENLRKEELGLIPVPHVDSYRGMIFGSWASEITSLAEYLGDMRFYLDLYLAHTDKGVEVVGSPHVWEVNTNWKFAADNFTGDNFHIHTAHGSIVSLGMMPPDPMSLAGGHLVDAGSGHVLHVVPGPPDPVFADLGMPPELVAEFDRNLLPAQRAIVHNTAWSVGTVFPNLSFLQVMVQGDEDSPMTPFLSFRTWEPTGPTTTRVSSYLLVDKDAPEWYRQASYEAYVRTFGPSGIFEQDDMENWEDCTRANSGKIAQRYDLHHGMGLHLDPDPGFPGPGTAYPGSYGERTQLAFYDEWKKWMTGGVPR
ncbi:SRPBCC family protein [Streptomyces sp. NPDC057199]|uniref:aromatic ring-hydroxylating oxygenase subunit alpha n=1 Tax=Streptomyces sp. NPDC057199 TaxID=3346047 RepID=UPI003644FDEE